MKIQDYIQRVADRLDVAELCYGHGTDNPLDEAFYLIYGLLGIPFTDEAAAQRELSRPEMDSIEESLKARIEDQIPTAYLVGRAWFAGHEFYCDSRALVPRSPIAELVLGDFEPLLPGVPARVLDLCTGGGSIGISIALQWPSCRVDLADISTDALALAQKNCEFHDLTDRVRTVESDLFQRIDGEYDLIVSNPPYVPRSEYVELPTEFEHEPELGLVSPDDGLQIPLQILRNSVDHLTADGLLVMEVGFSHAQLSRRLAEVPLLWLEFENGGDGVLALTARQLEQYREQFN